MKHDTFEKYPTDSLDLTPRALQTLKSFFADATAQGPMSCAAFRMNNEHESPDRNEESLLIRQQCVTLAQALIS